MFSGFRAYVVLLIILTVLIAIAVGYFVVQTLKNPEAKRPSEANTTTSPPPPPEIIKENPLVRFVMRDGKFIVEWENLPLGTFYLDIFRRKGKGAWEKWKTLSVGARYGGNAEIQLGKGETTTGYTFYAEASSGGGDPSLWISSSTAPVTGGSPPPPPPPPPSASPTAPSSTPTTPAPTSSQGTPPPSPQSTSTSQATDTIIYYTPSGEVSGTASTTQTANFWIQYVHSQIEINWQNLPTSTNKFFVERATAENGPWSLLLEQKDPDVVGPSFIRVLDDSVNTPHYYRMRTFNGTELLATYGPALLNPVE